MGFEVGDEVEVIRDYNSIAKRGMQGKVVILSPIGNLGIGFKYLCGGHDCDGYCVYGYGQYVDSRYLKLIKKANNKKEKTTMGLRQTVIAVYSDSTADAVLVDKYADKLGYGTDDFRTGLALQRDKKEVLTEIQRLEEEANKKD